MADRNQYVDQMIEFIAIPLLQIRPCGHFSPPESWLSTRENSTLTE